MAKSWAGLVKDWTACLPNCPISAMSRPARPCRCGKSRPDPEQPRKRFDEDALNQLADSITENGLLQPIAVRPKRWAPGTSLRASAAGVPPGWRTWTRSWSSSKDVTDEQAAALALIENLQREDLDPHRGWPRAADSISSTSTA